MLGIILVALSCVWVILRVICLVVYKLFLHLLLCIIHTIFTCSKSSLVRQNQSIISLLTHDKTHMLTPGNTQLQHRKVSTSL